MTERMESVDHDHPAQRAVAGAYRRGRQADGLRADGAGDESDVDADPGPETVRMHDVSHTPTDGDGTNGVWERGETDSVRDDDE